VVTKIIRDAIFREIIFQMLRGEFKHRSGEGERDLSVILHELLPEFNGDTRQRSTQIRKRKIEPRGHRQSACPIADLHKETAVLQEIP
jgi:hypothetical protein